MITGRDRVSCAGWAFLRPEQLFELSHFEFVSEANGKSWMKIWQS
jgi:hypothetical protein